MAVYSMTGYATAQQGGPLAGGVTESGPTIGMELRSVNSRFLDISFKLADDLRSAEPALRELLTGQLKRGKVEVRAWIEGRQDASARLPGAAELQKLVSLQDSVRAWLPSAQPLSVAEVLTLTARPTGSSGELHEQAVQLGKTVAQALVDAREREGRRLAAMLTDRLQQLRQLARDAQPLIPQLVAQQRQRFVDRWNEALAATTSDPAAASLGNPITSDMARDRALTEATAFAIRIDVAEELTRLDSHLSEIERLLKKGADVGKRLDFLIQELHREANTLGSKSSSLELTRISVDMKVLIEQMREQVQNIE
jgi:uncharacterized protein (TIGR00255 family)